MLERLVHAFWFCAIITASLHLCEDATWMIEENVFSSKKDSFYKLRVYLKWTRCFWTIWFWLPQYACWSLLAMMFTMFRSVQPKSKTYIKIKNTDLMEFCLLCIRLCLSSPSKNGTFTRNNSYKQSLKAKIFIYITRQKFWCSGLHIKLTCSNLFVFLCKTCWWHFF